MATDVDPPFKDERFRGDYRYANSPAAIRRFPYPFAEDSFRFALNVEPHVPGPPGSVVEHAFDVDEHYVAECRDRALTLARDPGRCLSLPHMLDAEWDTLELLMTRLAADYPRHFGLERDGSCWSWTNRPLGMADRFSFGDAATLPCPPLEYVTRQMQGDFVLLDQRDGNLWADAGMLTSQADWSLAFDLGMSFAEWHAPVPMAHELGIFDRALQFLLMLQADRPARRLNWSMTVNPRLDTATETYPEWGPERATLTPFNVADKLHLRVELQTLFRLPRSHAILFSIRSYLASLRELSTRPGWAARLHRVLKTLPPALVEYKGLGRTGPIAIGWLAAHDDGRPLAPGSLP